MEDSQLNNAFIITLENRIPKKTKLADFIAETLCIEKETAYRRLRGEVQFTFKEVGLLAQKLNISIDEIIIRDISGRKRQGIMQLPLRTLSPTGQENYIDEAINYLENIVDEPHSEYGIALSGIAFSLYLKYSYLYRFFVLKYVHHADNSLISVAFENIDDTDFKLNKRDIFYILFRKFSYTYYIWDKHIIPMLVSDIKYAHSIRLVTEEEVSAIKKDIHHLLNDLEQLALRGIYGETGNKFELYISDAHIDVTYAYMSSENKHIGMLSSFIFNATASEEKEPFNNIYDWVKSLKRFSTLISGIGERERISFFEEQRKIVNSL